MRIFTFLTSVAVVVVSFFFQWHIRDQALHTWGFSEEAEIMINANQMPAVILIIGIIGMILSTTLFTRKQTGQ